MTEHEAIKWLKIVLEETDKVSKETEVSDIYKKMCCVAIEALEKQIPKKPIDVITEDNEFICMICPCCQEIAVEFNDVYCSRCGQKLDWSE